MHENTWQKNWLIVVFFLLNWYGATLFSTVVAQTQMTTVSGSLVTASVPDIVSPSIPILIAPEDESILTDSTPTFVWYGSTDNVGIDHYDLWLNGAVKLATITPVNQDTPLYTLDVNEADNTLSLTIKQAIGDGTYTWSIVAADAASNTSSSATWNFTVDTLAPNLSVTKIEDDEVLITTQDSQTIPTAPIVVKHKDPLISGLGEPFATLVIILSIPGQNTTTESYTLDTTGAWSFQFPKLDKNVLATLTLIIEDKAGHTNVLTPIQFIYKPEDDALNVTPTVTPVATTPSPRPTIFLPALTPSPFPTLRPSEQSPLQPFITLFNKPKTDLVIKRGRDTVTFITVEQRPMWEWLSLFVLVFPTLLLILVLLDKLGRIPNLTTVKLIWWWFGYGRKQRPDGEVHDRASLEELWLIPIQVTNCKTNQVVIATITDRFGQFVLPQFDSSEFIIEPKWSGLLFPSIAKRPQSLPWHHFYLGEIVTYDKALPWPFLHIPVEKLIQQPRWQKYLLETTEWRGPIVVTQYALISLICITSPSVVTSIPLLICVALGFVRFFTVRKSKMTNNSTSLL